MGTSIYGIAVSALNAAQVGMTTTEHNIANANTPGYNRQTVELAVRQAQYTGAGFIGQGVDAVGVKRVYSEFLARQVLQEQGLASQLNTYYAQIRQIDNVMADPDAGMSPAIQQFFTSVNNVANSPESVAARQTMLGSANFLASRFQAINQRLIEIGDSVNGQIGYSVTQINSYAKQIAALNQNIVVAQSAGTGMPNDLLDQRDLLVSQLNQEIKATVVNQGDGSYNVFIGNGQPLVVGGSTSRLSVQTSASDPSKLDVTYTHYNGKTSAVSASALQGGSLGGLLAFRDEALTTTQNSLGRVAMAIGGALNTQHQLGQDLNGALGGKLFNLGTPQTNANTNNTSTATLSAAIVNPNDYTALTASDYELRYDGANYFLTRLSDNQVTSLGASLPATPVDGLTLTMTGTPDPADRFLIRPTQTAARDFSVAVNDVAKIAAAAPVRSNATLTNVGTGMISAPVVSQPGSLTPPLTDVNLKQPVTITFTSATTYDVTGTGTGLPATGLAYTPGANISYNGWTVQITGSPAANDTFTVGSNTQATADGRNMLLLAGLQTQNQVAGGTTSFQGAYSQLVSYVGSKTRELEVTSKAQATMVDQSIRVHQSFSGVNLDEEAANLLRYQRAYQAAGKAMQVANTMFDTILQLM